MSDHTHFVKPYGELVPAHTINGLMDVLLVEAVRAKMDKAEPTGLYFDSEKEFRRQREAMKCPT